MMRWTLPLWLLVVGVAPVSARAQQPPDVPEETQRELETLGARIAQLEAEQQSTQMATIDVQSELTRLQQELASLQERAAAINASRARRLSALSSAEGALGYALVVLGTSSGELDFTLEMADAWLSAAADEAARFGAGGEAAMIDQALANVRSARSAVAQHDFEDPYEYLVTAVFQTQQARLLAQAQPPQTAAPLPVTP